MTSTTTITAAMTSTSSNSPIPVDVEEPRKKGSRGGKRPVTHLSKAQLARKRANDREAQRNIRQRTKEHIENLERKVKELEQGRRSGSIERVLKRNRELEEVEKLRAQITGHHTPITGRHTPVLGAQSPSEIPEDLMVPHKVELYWATGSAACAWPQPVSHIPVLNTNQIPTSNAGYSSATFYPATTSSMGYDDEGSIYTPTESWGSPAPYGGRPQTITQTLSKSVLAWSPIDPTFSHHQHPSRFPDMQMSGFSDMVDQQTYSSTCWQNQPQIYYWQMPTKLKPPVTYLDQLMHSVIHAQRHLFATNEASREELVASFPSVHLLFNQPGPPQKTPSEMTKLMEKYALVLNTRDFPLIPEKLASFMCMYRFIQWQIAPSYSTYNNLHEWQTPRPSQLMIPHCAWMDLPPWGKFRDRVIENQSKYDTSEFQRDYTENFTVNFPFDPMKALIFEGGRMLISPVLERHRGDIGNMSMKKAFGDKYPEFRDVCRIDEVSRVVG